MLRKKVARNRIPTSGTRSNDRSCLACGRNSWILVEQRTGVGTGREPAWPLLAIILIPLHRACMPCDLDLSLRPGRLPHQGAEFNLATEGMVKRGVSTPLDVRLLTNSSISGCSHLCLMLAMRTDVRQGVGAMVQGRARSLVVVVGGGRAGGAEAPPHRAA